MISCVAMPPQTQRLSFISSHTRPRRPPPRRCREIDRSGGAVIRAHARLPRRIEELRRNRRQGELI